MEIQTPKQKYFENTANTIIHNLTKRQIEGYYCPDSKSAIEKALELIPEESTIGYGGSMTLEEIGIINAIKNSNYTIIDRNLVTNEEQEKIVYSKIFSSDYFLMSTNAITIDGELINIDGRGNRVAFLCFGPQSVLILCGMNKVVPDIESGFKRIRNLASPLNAIRLNRNIPCAILGKCEDCFSNDCMCGQFVITRRSGIPNRIKIILIGEELGY